MEKIILIGENNKLSIKATKWLSISMGIIWFLLGAVNLLRAESLMDLRSLLSIVIIITSIVTIFYGLTAFSKTSKYALRLKVEDNYLEYKSNYLRPVTRINWIDVKEIRFDAYRITFQLNREIRRFSYRSNPEVSKEIKKTLGQMAESKNIPVIGG